jgi:hypothetical protein
MHFSRLATVGLRSTVQGPRASFKLQFINKMYRSNGMRFQSTRASSGSQNGSQQKKKKSGIKALIQEYGYSALGVYLLLSALDFPLCFVVVHSYGVDKVKEVQTEVMNYLKKATGFGEQKQVKKTDENMDSIEPEEEESTSFWDSPLFTEALVAYALHKSFIFIRVPVTAAVTPSVVKQLRAWGFNVGKQKLTTIAQQAKAKTTQAVVDKTQAAANSPKFGTSASKRQKWTSWFF